MDFDIKFAVWESTSATTLGNKLTEVIISKEEVSATWDKSGDNIPEGCVF
jgi:hypothetical protein